MYHQIGEPNPKGTPFRGLTVHPDDFARQMRWMRFLGYRGLSMRDVMPYVRTGVTCMTWISPAQPFMCECTMS